LKEWKSAEDILNFAINEEEGAAKFYTDLAEKMAVPAMRKVFQDFAKEEEGHKAKLEGVKKSGRLNSATEVVQDLQIVDYLVDVEPSGDLDYQQALILAMKKEKAAFKLYTDLAAAADEPHLRDLLLSIAQEEAKHKLRFEVEYDDHVFREG